MYFVLIVVVYLPALKPNNIREANMAAHANGEMLKLTRACCEAETGTKTC